MLHFSDFCELVRKWLFKMTSKHSAQVLPVALKCWEAVKWLAEGIAGAGEPLLRRPKRDLLAVSSVWINQIYIYMLDKVSLNRNAEDRHLLIGGWQEKNVAWKAGTSPHVLCRSSGSCSLLQCWWRLREWNTYRLLTYQRAWEKPDHYPKPVKWAVCHVLGPVNTAAQRLTVSQYYTAQVGAHSRK